MGTDKQIYIIWIIFVVFSGFFYTSKNSYCITDEAFEMISSEIKKNTIRISSKFPNGESKNGFGFIVGERLKYLYIVTARHVVVDEEEGIIKASSVKVSFYYDQGRDHSATILNVKNEALDVALITLLRPEDFNYSENSFTLDIKRNEKVWFIGRNRYWYVPLSFKPGGVIKAPDPRGIMTIELPTIRIGTSGAPLFSEKGIAGLIIKDNIDNAKAISIQTVKKFVKSVNYPWGKEYKVEKQFTNSLGMNFVLIPAGTFMMGSPEKQHRVTLTQNFYMQTTEVTQGQWRAVMGNNPSENKVCGDRCPVENINWNNAQEFIDKLNTVDRGRKYRLPTEAEWEYAARAGTKTQYFWGNHEDCSRMNYGVYWVEGDRWDVCGDPERGLHTTIKVVMSYSPNGWQLYDMHGNVWEWCQDRIESFPGDYPADEVIDPTGSTSGKLRIVRGGSFHCEPEYCSSYDRNARVPYGSFDVGFRLCASGH